MIKPALKFGLTGRQRDCMAFLETFIAEHKASPSFEEIKDALGLGSKSGVHRLLTSLEERGFIVRLESRARSIEIVRESPKQAAELRENDLLRFMRTRVAELEAENANLKEHIRSLNTEITGLVRTNRV